MAGRDGPEARPPPDLMQVPDALPKLEPIRQGGPNKPYGVLGGRYEPLPARAEYVELADANASPTVFVDDQSGLLVVWAEDDATSSETAGS